MRHGSTTSCRCFPVNGAVIHGPSGYIIYTNLIVFNGEVGTYIQFDAAGGSSATVDTAGNVSTRLPSQRHYMSHSVGD